MTAGTDGKNGDGSAPEATGSGGWSGLAPYYDRIFPPGRAQLDFIGTVLARTLRPVRRVLDVGCATGGYALALADMGFQVTGVDLDPEMVRLARANAARWADRRAAHAPGTAAGRGPKPRFLVRDMADLHGLPEPGQDPFDAVICLGNTLPHMLSAGELGAALGEMARVLASGGTAILQTVNYDRITAEGGARFRPMTLAPTGEARGRAAGLTENTVPRTAGLTAGRTAGLVFERLYLPRSDGLVTFVTTLREEGSGRIVVRSETLLRPMVREELETIARMAFHGEVLVYGDFLFSPWHEASPATVVVASRGNER
jgi:SAM-dependent methyltransferase